MARVFAVQKHAASRLHWDLRLELDGVLKSWAVTRGPSLDPAERRLAVEVEDHPVDYASFEGVIPEGYGKGAVIVWDRGTWAPVGGADPAADLAAGHLKFEVAAERMTGRWALVRMKPRPKERGTNWLLVKDKDAHARPGSGDALVREHAASVASGRTIEDLGGPRTAPAASTDPAAASKRSRWGKRSPDRASAGAAPADPTFRDFAVDHRKPHQPKAKERILRKDEAIVFRTSPPLEPEPPRLLPIDPAALAAALKETRSARLVASAKPRKERRGRR